MTRCCNYIFLYNISRSAFTIQRTFFLFSTVTIFRLIVFSIDHLFVVWLEDRTHIGSTGIAEFYSISIKYFVQRVILTGHVYLQGLGIVLNIRWHCLAKWQCDISSSILPFIVPVRYYPLFLNAVWYSTFEAWNITAFEKFFA